MASTRNVMQPLLLQKQMQPTVQQETEGITIDVPVEKPTPPAPTTSKLFTEDELEAARKQEKDKLYERLNKEAEKVKALEEQLNLFNQEREEQKRLAEEARQAEEAERKRREEEELSVKELLLKKEDEWRQQLSSAEQQWQERLAQIEREREEANALLEAERKFQALESYRNRRLSEEQDDIMPELMDIVKGNSEEEIEIAISAAKEKTAAIMSNIQQHVPARVKSVPPTGSAPIGPMDTQTEQRTLTADDIRNMSMDEYTKVRDRLLSVRPNRGRF